MHMHISKKTEATGIFSSRGELQKMPVATRAELDGAARGWRRGLPQSGGFMFMPSCLFCMQNHE